jgi:hypothetical protein
MTCQEAAPPMLPYLGERCQALELWGEHVLALVEGRASNVVVHAASTVVHSARLARQGEKPESPNRPAARSTLRSNAARSGEHGSSGASASSASYYAG